MSTARLGRCAPSVCAGIARAELHYFAQNEKEYHDMLHEHYLSSRQHQEEQQRLNQVLYGPFDHRPQAQQQYPQQQPVFAAAPAPQQRVPLAQYNAATATNQAPPQAMAWQQVRPPQLAGSKRHCEPFSDLGAAPKHPAFR